MKLHIYINKYNACNMKLIIIVYRNAYRMCAKYYSIPLYVDLIEIIVCSVVAFSRKCEISQSKGK